MKESIHAITSKSSLQASVYARKDIFKVVEKLPDYLNAEGERILRKHRLEKFLNALHVSAWAGVKEYIASAESRCIPAYVAEGQEANWLWLDRKLDFCRNLPYLYAADFISSLCGNIRKKYQYGIPGKAAKAQVILNYLEKRYGYLTKVITPHGLHLLVFPTLANASDFFDLSFGQKGLGAETTGIIFANCEGESRIHSELLVYESAGAMILDHCRIEDVLDEAVVSLLEQHWDPNIRSQRPEDQISAYYDAILMGLAYKAPYGNFDWTEKYDQRQKEFWSHHAKRLINNIGGGNLK